MLGSGALPDKMLDLGLCTGDYNPAGPYPNPFPNPEGQSLSLLNLPRPKISINVITFNNPHKQHFTRKCIRSECFVTSLTIVYIGS